MTLNFGAAYQRVRTGLLTWPASSQWRMTAWVFVFYASLAGSIGFGTGLYKFEPNLDLSLVRVAIIAFFVPAIGEEVFFRGICVRLSINDETNWLQMAFALTLFLAWHPLNALLFFPSVLPLFSDWRFLLVTAFLGVACIYLWQKTRSLWPPIFVHWLAVVIWKGFLGAPRMM